MLLAAAALAAPMMPVEEPSGPVWIGAFTTALRLGPSPGALEVVRLRPGTPVDALERRGSWVRVALPDRPADHALAGWVSDRALASVPRPPAIEPAVPLAIAACVEGRADLVATWTPEAGFDAHDGTPWAQDLDPALVALGDDLAVAPWFVELALLPGTPFPAPFARSHWNDDSGPYAAEPCDGICGAQRLVLGPCPGGAATVATVPLEPVPSPFVEQDTPMSFPALYDGEPTEVPRRLIRRPTGETVLVVGKPDTYEPYPVEPTRWYRVVHGGYAHTLGVVRASGGHTAHVILVLVHPDGAVEHVSVEMDGAGC